MADKQVMEGTQEDDQEGSVANEKSNDKGDNSNKEKEENSAVEEANTAPKKAITDKVDILFKATGDAPIMKKKKWKVDHQKTIAYLTDFIKKFIKCEPSESLQGGSEFPTLVQKNPPMQFIKPRILCGPINRKNHGSATLLV